MGNGAVDERVVAALVADLGAFVTQLGGWAAGA